MGSNAKFTHPIPLLWEEPITVNNEKERNNSNLPKSAVDNNYSLSNQLILLPIILSEILSLLINISRVNNLLLSETFQNLDEDLESARTEQLKSSQ